MYIPEGMELFTLGAKETFLINLKAVMDDRNLSQTDLANLVGFSRQQVSNIFNSDQNLSLNTTDKIAQALKLKETDLFNPDFKPSKTRSK